MITILELFAGCGGLAQGFQQTRGYKILYANEYAPAAAGTYKLNHTTTIVSEDDVTQLSTLRVEQILEEKHIDLIIGGPPCQGFSTTGKRDIKDPRNSLFMEFIRFVQYFQPQAFLMENVAGILSMKTATGERVVDIILNAFQQLGYKVETKLLNAAEYGIPQVRKRTIFLGNRMGWDNDFPLPTHGPGKISFRTLRDVISNLPNLKSGKKDPNDPLHIALKHNPRHLKMMKCIPEGGAACDIANVGLRPKSGFQNQYARLVFDKPGMTITRNFQCVSSCRCIHPIQNRALTAREAARIQTFPDSYKFKGTLEEIRLQIGNAVPPLLAQTLATHLKSIWFKI